MGDYLPTDASGTKPRGTPPKRGLSGYGRTPCSVSAEEYQDIFDRASKRREQTSRRGITGQQVSLLDDFGYHLVLATLDWANEKQNARPHAEDRT
jgi:hypothetical protein